MLIWLTISLCVSKSCARKNPLVGDKANGRASAASILNYSPFMPPKLESGQGPVFTFPDDMAADVRTVSINETNGHLLRGGFDDRLPDIRYRNQPFCAVVEDNRAVSICASVRITDAVHCAGVETLTAHRQRGQAARAVADWALTVRSLGANPFYSTSWDNEASRGLAARLHLAPIGIDFHAT